MNEENPTNGKMAFETVKRKPTLGVAEFRYVNAEITAISNYCKFLLCYGFHESNFYSKLLAKYQLKKQNNAEAVDCRTIFFVNYYPV